MKTSGRILFYVVLVLVAHADMLAQTDSLRRVRIDNVRSHIDSVFTDREKKSRTKYDTLYITKPHQLWTVKGRVNVSGTAMHVRTKMFGSDMSTELNTDLRVTVSGAVSYRGISAGIAINPAKLRGKNNDYEFNMNAYSNRFGADVIYSSAKTFHGDVTQGDDKFHIDAGMVRQRLFTVNTYYVFNYRRFSYPAAFSQSQIQRRSAGSWILSMSYLGNFIHVSDNINDGNAETSIHNVNIGIGGGYGYNLVTHRNWFFHLSSTPEFVVFEKSRLTTNDEQKNMPFKFPSVIVVGRMAVVHYLKKYFIGGTVVVTNILTGDRDELEISNTKWRTRIFVGMRL